VSFSADSSQTKPHIPTFSKLDSKSNSSAFSSKVSSSGPVSMEDAPSEGSKFRNSEIDLRESDSVLSNRY
jgi:hypothetical protein